MNALYLNSSLGFARQSRAILFGLVVTLLPVAASDFSWKQIQFGGFASQGYLKSSANDYLGDTSDGTFDFREYAVNTSWSTGKWRIGAQAFGQKLGVYGDDKIKLDWATIDYQAAQWFGLRAGRVKLPRGLYNEALDLDSVRPFVLLPQSLYDNRLRDFNASFDGGMAYGNVGLRSLGSVDYRLYYGSTPLSLSSGAADFFNSENSFPGVDISLDSLMGGTLFWNSPVNGLRLGYSYTVYRELNNIKHVVIPQARLDKLFFRHTDTYDHHQLSAEYVRGDWTFAVEAARETAPYKLGMVGVHTPASPSNYIDYKSDLFYVSAARRINRWLELGAYGSFSREYFPNNMPANAAVPPSLKQTDYAFSSRFDLSERMIFKLEFHALDGTGKVFNTAAQPNPPSTLKPSWTMLAAKVTYSF